MLILLTLFLFLNLLVVNASGNIQAKIGNKYFDTFEEAYEALTSKDTLTILHDLKFEDTFNINKDVNLNLNGHTITAPEMVFKVENGSLNLSGTGTIKELKPNYGAIVLLGNTTNDGETYSSVKVGKDITLEGWAGIFVTQSDSKSYGVSIEFDGNINSVKDTEGVTGSGIYINGKIKDENNSPTIKVLENANIKSEGIGIYMAGYSRLDLNGGVVSGSESGISIKSGILNINGGEIRGTGPDNTPTDPNNSGSNASGAALQIESNNGYAGNIEILIKNGNLISDNSDTFYEFTANSSTETKVKKIHISGGNFKATNKKNDFNLSSSFKTKYVGFITGGTFSSNPTSYLQAGYKAIEKGNSYEAVTVMQQVFGESTSKSSNAIIIIVIIISILALILLYLFLKRKKLS